MVTDKYFVIYMSEDGDMYVQEFTEHELEEELNKEPGHGGFEDDYYVFLDHLPYIDPAYWGRGVTEENPRGFHKIPVLLIKGEIVTPKVEEVITRRSL